MSAQASTPERVNSAWAARGPGAPKLALGYGLLGVVALGAAPSCHALAWLPAWFGVANLVLAYGYAVNRPAIFGKRSDGALAPLSVALLLPYLLFVWGFFRLKLAGLRREPCWHRVSDGLYLGRKPSASELPADCDLVVDLTAEFPEGADVVAARAYRCLPTLNRHVPGDAELRALLHELHARKGGGIYVHCGAGRGRSAMLAAGLLVMRGEAQDAHDAEALLRRIRPGVYLHPAQKAIIDRSCSALRHAAAPQSLAQYVESRFAWSAPPAPPARTKK
jgi:protein-tyrosine phosphatase